MQTTLFLMAGIGLMGAVLVYLVMIFNSLMAVKNNIDRARANIDVLLKQRFDEIPQLINVCKGYMKYEGSILEKLALLRGQYTKVAENNAKEGPHNKEELDNLLSGYSDQLFAVAEAHPDLKASSQFLYLQKRLSEIEMEIADRRELLNDSVTIFNTRVDSFPDIILATTLQYKKYEFFKTTEGERMLPTEDLKHTS